MKRSKYQINRRVIKIEFNGYCFDIKLYGYLFPFVRMVAIKPPHTPLETKRNGTCSIIDIECTALFLRLLHSVFRSLSIPISVHAGFLLWDLFSYVFYCNTVFMFDCNGTDNNHTFCYNMRYYFLFKLNYANLIRASIAST